jgi:GDPmannose 4,6-dehydratase
MTMSVKPKKALICGISGQDGVYLALLLLEKGYQVFGASRRAEVPEKLSKLGLAKSVAIRQIDMTDSADVVAVLKEIEPDELYNLSGQSWPGASFDVARETLHSIATGTAAILEAMCLAGHRPKFLNAASSECFADIGDVAIDETTPFGPRNPYGVAKVASAYLVRNFRQARNIFAANAYLFNHESPLRNERFVTQKIVAAACRIASGSKERLTLGNIDIVRDWGWAPDYVDAMWRMLQLEAPHDFVIGTGRATRLSDFVQAAFGAVGLDWRHHVEIDKALFRPMEPKVVKCNPHKAEDILQWKATCALEEIALRMVTEFRARQSIQ